MSISSSDWRNALRPWFAGLVLFLLVSNVAAAGSVTVTVTVSVLPFSSKSGDSSRWVGTALADMLTLNLAEAKNVSVLDRGQLQAYLRELHLQQSGFVDAETAHRLGRIAKLDQVILGNYSLLPNRRIAIKLLSTDTGTQTVAELATVSGNIDDLSKLAEQLTIKYLNANKYTPDANELARIRSRADYTLPALENYYQGLIHYDQGLRAEAFSHFFLASEADRELLRARFMMAQVLLDLGRQDMAISIYKSIYQQAPDRVEALDAQLKVAELIQHDDPEAAQRLFQALFDKQAGTPHQLYAAMQLGQLYSARGEWLKAYSAYAAVDAARAMIEKDLPVSVQGRSITGLKPTRGIKPGLKASSYVRWEGALALYKPALQKMIELYARLYREGMQPLPAPPRGVILVEAGGTEVMQDHRQRKGSLFHERVLGEDWREDYYVLIMPGPSTAEAASVSIKGKLTELSPQHDFTIKLHEFPLRPDSENNWLGVLYGQTGTISNLQKNIPFYGKRLDILVVQIVENHGRVYEWSVRPKLNKTAATLSAIAVEQTRTENTEAMLIAALPVMQSEAGQPQLVTRADSRSLSVARTQDDKLLLVASLTETKTQRLNLFVSESSNGTDWSDLSPLPVNAFSDDRAPTLVLAEDGNIHLYWLSNRHGDGWSLWHSYRSQKTGLWLPAEHIPFRAEGEKSTKPSAVSTPYHYSILQDQAGRWVLAVDDSSLSRIRILTSSDAKQWKSVSQIPYQSTIHNLAIGMDNTSRFHLALFTGRNSLVMMYSNDASHWQADVYGPYQGFGNHSTALYRASLTAEGGGKMVLLFADAQTGVQYSRFLPGQAVPESDLVKDANLYPYAAVLNRDGTWLLSMLTGTGIEIRRYRKFHASDNPRNSVRSMLYHEIEKDADGNQWQRIFARPRMILPDVSAVAVAANGRVWWGIETGIMSEYQQQFTMKDVSQGFFNNHITDIVVCDGRAVFAAGDFRGLSLGAARVMGGGQPGFNTVRLGGAGQSVTAMVCLNDGVLFATSKGSLRLLDKPGWELKPGKAENRTALTTLTALAVGNDGKTFWAGSVNGHVYKITQMKEVKLLPVLSDNAVTAMAVSSDGQLWVAVEGEGIFIWQPDTGKWTRPEKQPYKTVGKMLADRQAGVWITAGDSTHSRGLVHHTGKSMRWFNPPSRTLTAPTGIAQDRKGNIWVGTSFHGLFRLEVAGK